MEKPISYTYHSFGLYNLLDLSSGVVGYGHGVNLGRWADKFGQGPTMRYFVGQHPYPLALQLVKRVWLISRLEVHK